MKRYFKFLFVSMLVMSMQGCSKDLVITDEPNAPEENESVQLRLTGNVAYMTPETRLGASGFKNNDPLGVYVSTKSDLQISNNKADNKKFVYNESTGVIEATSGNDIYWSSDSEKFNIYAYYPHVSNVTSANAIPFSVKANQSSDDNYYGSDFLRASVKNVEKTSEPVEMSFWHLMSKISITLQLDKSFPESEFTSEEKEFTIEGLITDCSVDLEKEQTNIPVTIGSTKTIIIANGSNKSYTVIVPPQNTNNVKFRLRVGDKYYSSTITSVSYLGGKVYNYALFVKKSSGVSIESVSIKNWDNGNTYDGNMTQETN